MPVYQIISDYVMTRRQDFVSGHSDVGAFLIENIYDRTASKSNRLFQSSMIGALWPNGSKSIQVEMPTLLKGTDFEDDETKAFYEKVTKIMIEKIDHPKAGFGTALDEYMADQGAFGISGISAFETDEYDVPIQFSSLDVKTMVVDEGRNGFVDTIYIQKRMTLKNMVLEYGEENLSAKLREKWGKEGAYCSEKFAVIHAIEPRIERDPYKFGSANMPVASIHIEVETKKILRESGFHEMPSPVCRFWKMGGEKYARSPAMEALSDIAEINAIREASILAIEKNLDPPIAVYDDGSLGGGVIDTSAGAINVFSVSGRLGAPGQKVFEQMVDTGELNSTYARITELKEEIKDAFFIDRLLDFNSEQRMQNPEVLLRDRLRGQSLGTIYSRQITELFMPLLERVFSILLGKGLFGVLHGSPEEKALLDAGEIPNYIPDKVQELLRKGQDVYKVTFISPAARIMQAEALQGIQQTVTTATNIAASQIPDAIGVIDNIDLDAVIRQVQELTGAPSVIMRSLDAVKKLRQARQEQQAQLQQMEADKAQAETLKNVGQAAASVGGAQAA